MRSLLPTLVVVLLMPNAFGADPDRLLAQLWNGAHTCYFLGVVRPDSPDPESLKPGFKSLTVWTSSSRGTTRQTCTGGGHVMEAGR